MTFYGSDKPNVSREKESIFRHPDTGETHTHRFVLTKNSQNNERSWSDDTEDGYDSDGVERFKKY